MFVSTCPYPTFNKIYKIFCLIKFKKSVWLYYLYLAGFSINKYMKLRRRNMKGKKYFLAIFQYKTNKVCATRAHWRKPNESFTRLRFSIETKWNRTIFSKDWSLVILYYIVDHQRQKRGGLGSASFIMSLNRRVVGQNSRVGSLMSTTNETRSKNLKKKRQERSTEKLWSFIKIINTSLTTQQKLWALSWKLLMNTVGLFRIICVVLS